MAAHQTLQDDPLVKIPAAVRAQSERADAIMAAVAAGQHVEVEQELDPALDPNALAAPPVVDPNAPAPPTPEPPKPAPAEDSWEHKFKSEAGRSAALREQVSGLSLQVQNLQNVLASMNQPKLDTPSGGELTFDSLTDEEKREYGEDLISVVGKKAMEQVAPYLKTLTDRIDAQSATIKSLTGKQSINQQQAVLDAMDADLPGWRVINDSDEFLSWLALPDTYSGAIRHNMLKEAFAQGNTSRVKAFFNGFTAEAHGTAPAGGLKPAPAAEPAPRITLEELAAPGKAKAAPSSGGPEQPKPIITRAQIANFYAEKAAGKWRGRDAEAAAAEKMIFDAQSEGRIR